MIKWKKSWPDQWEGLPVDVLPVLERRVPAAAAHRASS